MLTCKQVSRTLQKQDFADLSPFRQFLLKVHIKLCIVCGKFNKQVIQDQDMCCNYKKNEEESLAKQPGMDDVRKEAMKQFIADQQKDTGSPRT